ncbi:MAG: hypothetical protein M9911_00585 [Saprospiraceae bacterium]|nr:hypothetical protein [Saprospiraceae bacterium]
MKSITFLLILIATISGISAQEKNCNKINHYFGVGLSFKWGSTIFNNGAHSYGISLSYKLDPVFNNTVWLNANLGVQLSYYLVYRDVGYPVFHIAQKDERQCDKKNRGNNYVTVSPFLIIGYIKTYSSKSGPIRIHIEENDFVSRPQFLNSLMPNSAIDESYFSIFASQNFNFINKNLSGKDPQKLFNNQWVMQGVGTLVAKAKNISICYSNDGPPFKGNLLGDGYDRYWTGSGSINVRFKICKSRTSDNNYYGFRNTNEYMNLSYGFERFTADNTSRYIVSGILGLQNLNEDDKNKALLNCGAAYLKLIHEGTGLGIEARTIGSYDSDIQYMIHNKLNYSQHTGFGRNRLVPQIIFQPYLNFIK